MQRIFTLFLAVATVSAVAQAQANSNPSIQSQPAPVVRMPAAPNQFPTVTTTEPIAGVWLQTDANSIANATNTTGNGTEIHITRGRANVQVHHPADNSQILVDLPGGQTNLVKDGLYTFNAETNTVRVLRGEAEVYPATGNTNAKPVKIKEAHELTFAAGTTSLKSRDADPRALMSDLLPGGRPGAEGYGPYGDGYPYAYAPYPYAGYGWGYPSPYAWGYYPYGYGYPLGFGLGFGYYGGFRGRFVR